MARVDLLFDLRRQIVGVVEAHTAGVDQFEIPPFFAAIRYVIRSRVTPGRRIDNGQPSAREPIKQARFAHIRPADNHHLRKSHKTSLTCRCRKLLGPAGR